MAFKIFLVCSFFLLGRPQDVLTFLQPMRPALLLTGLSLVALVFSARPQEISSALKTPESKRYLLFFFIMILGIPFAYHKRLALEGVLLGYVVNVLYFVLLVTQVTTLQRLKSLAWVICLCAAMYSVFGLLLQGEGSGGGRFQVVGDAFDPNDTAYVLLSLFPLCLYFIRFDEGMLKKLVAIAAVCGAVATILLTGSRGGLLAFGAVLLILLLTKTGGVGKAPKVLLALVLAAIWLLMKDEINVERYMALADISSDYNVSAKGGRIALWQAAIDLSLNNPVFGVGVDCFAFANHLARERVGDTFLMWQVPHNSFLQIAAEVGLVGFAVFVLINLRSVRTFISVSRMQSQPPSPGTAEIRALSGLMLLGFVGLLVSGFFLSQGYSIYFTLYFALAAVIGRLHAGSLAAAESPRQSAGKPPSPGWGNPGKALP